MFFCFYLPFICVFFLSHSVHVTFFLPNPKRALTPFGPKREFFCGKLSTGALCQPGQVPPGTLRPPVLEGLSYCLPQFWILTVYTFALAGMLDNPYSSLDRSMLLQMARMRGPKMQLFNSCSMPNLPLPKPKESAERHCLRSMPGRNEQNHGSPNSPQSMSPAV